MTKLLQLKKIRFNSQILYYGRVFIRLNHSIVNERYLLQFQEMVNEVIYFYI